jgi:hypothetical protein
MVGHRPPTEGRKFELAAAVVTARGWNRGGNPFCTPNTSAAANVSALVGDTSGTLPDEATSLAAPEPYPHVLTLHAPE